MIWELGSKGSGTNIDSQKPVTCIIYKVLLLAPAVNGNVMPCLPLSSFLFLPWEQYRCQIWKTGVYGATRARRCWKAFSWVTKARKPTETAHLSCILPCKFGNYKWIKILSKDPPPPLPRVPEFTNAPPLESASYFILIRQVDTVQYQSIYQSHIIGPSDKTKFDICQVTGLPDERAKVLSHLPKY